MSKTGKTAFIVSVDGWDEATGVYAAINPTAAKRIAVEASKRAGYSVDRKLFKARRAEEFDPIVDEIPEKAGLNIGRARELRDKIYDLGPPLMAPLQGPDEV